MFRFLSLPNTGPDAFNILAGCAAGDEVDTVTAVRQVDLIRAISEEEGPWILSFRRPAVESIANLRLDAPLLRRWSEAVAAFHGRSEDQESDILTLEVADSLQDICRSAVEQVFDVFACIYG